MDKIFLNSINSDKKQFREALHEVGLKGIVNKEATGIILKTKGFYEVIQEEGLEDELFMSLHYGEINEFIIEIIRHSNDLAMEFILVNMDEIGFDINHIEKNRGWLEISMFFNSPIMVRKLIDYDIVISNRVANAVSSWMKDNSLFIKSQMHQKFNDEGWKRDFIDIVGMMSKVGNSALEQVSLGIINEEIQKVDASLPRSLSRLGPERIAERLLKLDNNTIMTIMDILSERTRER